MNILFLNHAGYRNWGGGEKWTLEAARGLAARGHRVVVLGRTGASMAARARALGLTADTLPSGVDYAPRTIAAAHAALRRYRADILIVTYNKDVRTGGVAAKLLGIPVVHRNGYPVLHDNWRHRLSFRFTDRILTNSRRIRDRYVGFGWIPAESIDVVPNGISPPAEPPLDRAVWREWGLDPAGWKIAVYAGRLSTVKRVMDLLEAMASLPAESRWRLVIVGAGAEEKALRHRAAGPDLADRVYFMGFHEEAAELVGAADLALLPSNDEGMPNTLLEAMIRGVPVAATPVGDVPYLLDEGRAGWLVPVGDPQGWRDLLLRLENDKKALENMGRAGRERVETHFTFEAMIDGVEASLRRAFAAHAPKARFPSP